MQENNFIKSLSEKEKKEYFNLIDKLTTMREIRERGYKETNNLSYSENYDLKRELNLGFVDLRDYIGANPEDSITKLLDATTGIGKSKITSIRSHLLSFQFEPKICAWNKNNQMIKSLGENTSVLIKKSLEAERWDEKKISIYNEYLEQGHVFVMESFYYKDEFVNTNSGWSPTMKISEFKAEKKETKKKLIIERKLLSGKDVYLSNLREPDIQKQSLVAVWDETSFVEAEKRFGKWERWKEVEKTKGKECFDSIANLIKSDRIFDSENLFWSIKKPTEEVGILYVFDNDNKTYQIIVNGIPMLPVGYSLFEVSPSGLIPIAKGDSEILSKFAYGKGVGDATFMDTKLADAVFKSMVQKMFQSAKPTMGNTSGKIIPKNLLYSSRLISGLREGQFQPLLPQESRTITQSDTTFLEVVRRVIADKTVDDSFEGSQMSGTGTATEYLQRNKNTIMKLYSLVLGLRNLEEQMARLRIYSIMSKWTIPEEVERIEAVEEEVNGVWNVFEKIVKKKEFARIISDAQLPDRGNKDGIADIRFFGNDETIPEPDDILEEEMVLSEQEGKPVSIQYLNAEKLSNIFDYLWYIDIEFKKEEDDLIQLMSYVDVLGKIQMLFPGSLNKDYHLKEISNKLKIDPDKAFVLQEQQVHNPATVGNSQLGDMPTMNDPAGSNQYNSRLISNPLSQAGKGRLTLV